MGSSRLSSFDNHVVHAHADESGKQVLGGGNEHRLHQAGGVVDLGHIAAIGGDFKIIDRVAEDNA